MLNGEGMSDQTVILKPHHTKLAKVQFHELPESVKVRFVRVGLETGESEVLVTNLLNTQDFPTEEFKTLYHLRWGVEGFYRILILRQAQHKKVGSIWKTSVEKLPSRSIRTFLC